ncbi:MAG: LamG domain-containing protein [Candidatus Poribacteria bacterium]
MLRFTIISGLLIILLVFSASAANIKDGLLVYLPFEEGTGKVTKDVSGRGNNGQITDAEWANGKFGKCLSFNGKSAFVEIPYKDDFNITDGITLAAWIKIDHLPLSPAYRGIINAKKSNYGPYLLQTSVVNGKNLYEFSFYIGAAWDWNVSTTEEVTDWVHLAGTFDTTTSLLYVNGKLDSTMKYAGKIADNTKEGVVIGHFYGLADRWFHGLIDEVAIYNRPITADEVKTLFAGSLNAVEPNSKVATTWGMMKKTY